jgi:hypothetical protein
LKFAGQSKFKGLTLFQDVNQDRVRTMLVTVAHYNCPVDDTHMGFTRIMLSDTASVIRNQWGDRIQNFKVLGLSQEC